MTCIPAGQRYKEQSARSRLLQCSTSFPDRLPPPTRGPLPDLSAHLPHSRRIQNSPSRSHPAIVHQCLRTAVLLRESTSVSVLGRTPAHPRREAPPAPSHSTSGLRVD